MADQTVIKFEPNGPGNSGLEAWPSAPPEAIQSGKGNERGHVYFTTDNERVTVGVWDCDEVEFARGPYPDNEFMIVLDGAITIDQDHGPVETFNAGEGFIMGQHLPCSFQVPEYARKFFFIFHDESGLQPDDPESMGAIRVDTTAPLPAVENQDPDQYLREVPEMGWLTLFRDLTGQFEVGLWDCSPMQRKPATLARSELMHILEGSGTITNGDGVVFEFSTGDTFLVPIGMGYQWRNDEYVKKVFCSFTPG